LIIDHYLIRGICNPLTAILGILVALFGSYTAAGFLSDAVNGLLPVDTVAELIDLKLLIALEVLIPVSLYFSVLLSFSKLYGDSEFTAMFALRMTPAKVMRVVLILSVCLAVIVAALSLFVRPWAYQKLHEISGRADTMVDVHEMQAGTFYVAQQGKRVIFVSRRDGPGAPARDVFVQIRHSDYTEIISARLAYQLPPTASDGHSDVDLNDAHIYDIGDGTGHADDILTAQSLLLDPRGRGELDADESAVASSTRRLATSSAAADIAEFQWRLSTPLSTLLLGMLGVPLSRVKPRQGKYAKFGAAILIYSGYYLLCTSARTWVQHGVVPGFPGIWWAPVLLSLVLLIALYGPNLHFRPRRGPA
jgi:lipopolysaccharide export system permease protein